MGRLTPEARFLYYSVMLSIIVPSVISRFVVKSRAIRQTLLVALVICLFLVVSCGKKDVKMTPTESIAASSVEKLLGDIKDAYVNKNMPRLQELTTSEGYRDLSVAVKPFDKASLRFTPTWMDIKDNRIEVHVAWEGKWEKGKEVDEERGLAVFVLAGNPYRLDEVHRASPFVFPQ
jgi:hypothetical protein